MTNRFGPADPAVAKARSAVVTFEKGKPYALKVECFRGALPPPAPGAPGGLARLAQTGPARSWRAVANTDVKDAVAAAKQADVVIVVVGYTREIEGEESAQPGLGPARSLPLGHGRADVT